MINISPKKYIKTSLREYLNEQLLSSDNIESFIKLTKFKDRKKYADTHFKLLNKGTARYVYNINNEYILKLAKNNKGIEQNKTEIDISKNGKYNDIIANILEYDVNGIYLIQEKADVLLSDAKFTKITNMQLQGFLYYLRFNKKWDGENIEFYNKVNSLVNEFELDRFDIANIDSWGIINNKVVIVDYGLNINTARKLYGVNY